jgi:hypothetical protein
MLGRQLMVKFRLTSRRIIMKKSLEPIEIIIERHDGLLWGRVEDRGNFMPTPFGKNKDAVIANLKSLVTDYVSNEGKKDPFWSKVDFEQVEFRFAYDLEIYFKEHDYLKISSVARAAGLNAGLVRQYASGVKYPSAEQAAKISTAVKLIAKELMETAIYAG